MLFLVKFYLCFFLFMFLCIGLFYFLMLFGVFLFFCSIEWWVLLSWLFIGFLLGGLRWFFFWLCIIFLGFGIGVMRLFGEVVFFILGWCWECLLWGWFRLVWVNVLRELRGWWGGGGCILFVCLLLFWLVLLGILFFLGY